VSTLHHCRIFWPPKITDWAKETMNYLYETAFFDETPEDNLKAEVIFME
jgi:hypothetical protein